MERKKYPVGIQTFSEIIRGKYIYVDKTDLVWDLAHYAKFIFLSRPRRFGKSLLTTTLESYFKGEKELFEGLKIMNLEKDWEQYPVIHLDLSTAKGSDDKEMLRGKLRTLLKPYTDIYGFEPEERTPGEMITGIITRARQQTGQQVAVIIDEYDAPLLEVMHNANLLDDLRKVMQEFYTPLKASESKIKFCFVTGITKFSQLSIFSTINNLTNVTMDAKFGAICGITEQELVTTLNDDILLLAEEHDLSYDEMHQKLKSKYDGYRFTKKAVEIYNPYSIMKAFLQSEVANYWFESGTPSFLIRQLQHFHTDIMSLEKLEVPSSAFDKPTETMTTALPLLYQSGYLTIKDYDQESQMYTLSIPNQEVRIGYAEGLLPAYVGLESSDVQTGFALKLWRALKNGDVELALQEMKAYLASIPYVEGFKKKLDDAAKAEGFYEYTFYLIFSMLNIYVRTQVKCAGGRADIVIFMPDTIYVMELKVNGTSQEALAQIDDKGYTAPFQTDGRRIVKVGISFNISTRTIEDWVIE